MDDTRTQQMLDDLADVFLTGPVRRPAAPKEEAPAAPGPIRLEPKLASTSTNVEDGPSAAAPAPKLRLADAIDEASFAPPAPPPADAQRRPVLVQGVFLGNLPGFAGAWLAQYAQHLAEQHHGAVAIVHVDAKDIDVEFIGGHGQAIAPDGSVVEALDRWARTGELAAVLVHLPQPVTEAGQRIARDLDAWTIVCGADDAATVNAYCLLKQLLAGDPQPSRRRVAVMVMGYDEREARLMADSLNVTAAAYLGAPVQLAGWRKQIAPVQLQGNLTFAAESNPWSLLNAYLQALPKAQPTAAAKGAPAASPKPVAPEARQLAEAVKELAASASAEATAQAPEPRVARKSRDRSQDASPAAEPSPDLASYLPGSVKLEARCPDHPETQLLLDELGRVHLVRHAASGSATDEGGSDSLRSVVLDLLETRRWVRRHRRLLALTQRQCRFDQSAKPVLHVFTAQGKQAGEIVSRLGASVKIHLLQSVRVAGQTAWACSELN